MNVNYNMIVENEFEKPLYIKKHDEIIKYLKTYSFSDFFTIVEKVGGSERRMMRLINQMVENKELIVKDNKFDIPNNENKYKDIDFKYVEKEIKKIFNNRPKPTLLFDQRPVTYKTTIKRVKYMLDRNDIYDKNIVFLGDDDLTSIALALTKVKCNILMLDVDERLVDYINALKDEYKLNIEAKVYNALNNTPKELMHKFDVFATDPTPEKIPFTLFMNHAINLLKGKDSIIYTSIYSSAMEETLDLQNVINDMNLYITDMTPNFTHYQSIYELFKQCDIDFMNKYNIKLNEDSICFTETLFRMKLTNKTHKLKIKYKAEKIFGKATKRVIKDENNDVAKHDNKYLNEVEQNMINNKDKEYISE